MASQPSSLPTKQALASLWLRICWTVLAASVGYSGTETCPAIQIARSLISHQAQFFDRIATLDPGSHPWALRCAAMRRVWSATSAQVKFRTVPPPIGWVSAMRAGAACSHV
jgi:hypothetical protein